MVAKFLDLNNPWSRKYGGQKKRKNWDSWLSFAWLHNKAVVHVFLASCDNANNRLCQERLLRSENFATIITWHRASPLNSVVWEPFRSTYCTWAAISYKRFFAFVTNPEHFSTWFVVFVFLAQVLESEIRMSLSGPVACPETFNTESDEVGTLRPNESSWVWANFCDPRKIREH